MDLALESTAGFKAGDRFYYDDLQPDDSFEILNILYLSRDGGRVTIPTEPAIGRERAAQLALEAAAGRLSRPQVVEQHLWVSVAHGDQRLLWLVVLEEQGSQELARRLYVEIDAQNGAVLEASP
jgi:hypothetical protein